MALREPKGISRRQVLSLIGALGGGAAMYQAMSALGQVGESSYKGPLKLEGSAKGNRVLILGAGIAGLTAAMELRKAGYRVQVLEYNQRIGGRCWTIRGGDQFTELGGERQVCEFDKGLYINPGPWRIAHNHRAILDYCRRLGVPVEPFIEVNYNGYLHSRNVFGGKPQRIHQMVPDLQGHIGELLAKATRSELLDDALTQEEGELLREVLRDWAGLNKDLRYATGPESSKMRGYAHEDMTTGARKPSEPAALGDVLRLCRDSEIWKISNHSGHFDLHNPLFQPVGGIDMIAHAMAREVGDAIRFGAKVTAVRQDASGVRVTYEPSSAPGTTEEATADWCICTIPLSILGQMDLQVGDPMKRAIDSVAYSTSVKAGLQFKRRFWEEDDAIYGGFSHTDLPIRTIAYPSHGMNTGGPGVLYGAFMFGAYSYEFTGMTPAERLKRIVEYGTQIHPQYAQEFQSGVSVAWHRMPFSLGCFAWWTGDLLKEHYANLRAIDGRFALAGEALAPAVGGWLEGAALSGLDLVERIHQRVNA